MTLVEETRMLRRQLAELAGDPEWSLLVRYELLPQKPSPVWRQRLAQRVGRMLRILGLSRSRYLRQPWQAGLKHAVGLQDARPLLIWVEGVDILLVRESCIGIQRLLAGRTDLLPVLVTDVADFAFYSRLGWLVEYLPELSGEGGSYRDRKRRYLAWRYRDALIVPLSAGMASVSGWSSVLNLAPNL